VGHGFSFSVGVFAPVAFCAVLDAGIKADNYLYANKINCES